MKKCKAIVTGATGYIGNAIVKAYIEEGYIVGCVCRNRDKYESIYKNDRDVTKPIIVDVTNYDEVEKEINLFCEKYGNLDIVVNCVGGSARSKSEYFVKQKKEVMDEVVNVNLMGTMYVTRACLPHMNKGSVINIASYLGVNGYWKNAEYAAAKGGIIAMTKALAKEYAIDGIRFNCISPGYIPRPDAIKENGTDEFEGLSYLPGLIRGEDIANTVLFLTSDQSKYIIGQNIIVDGGANLAIKNKVEGIKPKVWHYNKVQKSKKYIIYGTGVAATKYVVYLQEMDIWDSIVAFCDTDKSKWGGVFCGQKVIRPMELNQKLYSDKDIIVATVYYDEICRILSAIEVDEKRIINYIVYE